uniref:Uncharacterized protein n=1 Tax=Anguilla anguilla TaxID=7936 RepID=A0A0E9VZJ8_ANGAN
MSLIAHIVYSAPCVVWRTETASTKQHTKAKRGASRAGQRDHTR